MADATPSRLGQINGAGDALALFLKVFSGEVLTTFTREAVYRPLHLTRTIASGKSAQFPTTGIITGYTHNPGDEILGNRINADERVINIEGLLIAPAFVPNIDEAMNHYDYRGIYSDAIALALSKSYDQDVGRTFSNAARQTTPNVKGVFLNDTLASTETNALFGTDGPTLFNGIYDGMVTLDQRDIPMSDRNIIVDPLRYSLLVKSEKPIDRRFNPDGSLGGYASGTVEMIRGGRITRTNNYPGLNDFTGWTTVGGVPTYVGTGGGVNPYQPASRQHDYSTSRAQIAHRSVAGTVALQDVTMEGEYDMRRQGWLMIGKYLTGHDWLRPEGAYELLSAAAAG